MSLPLKRLLPAVRPRLSIRHRLFACIVLVTLVMLALGAWTQYGFQRTVRALEGLLAESQGATSSVGRLRASIAQLKQHELSMMIGTSNTLEIERYKGLWETELATLGDGFVALANNRPDAAAKAAEARSALAEYGKRITPVAQQLVAMKIDASVAAAYAEQAKPQLDAAGAGMDALLADTEAALEASRAALAGQSRQQSIAVAAVGSGVIVLLALVLIATQRSINAPLDRAARLACRITEGDLSASTIDAEGPVETAELMRSLGAMLDSLRRIVAQVKASSARISAASGEIAHGNQDLSERTEQTASSLQQTAASMHQLTGTAGQTTDGACAADRLAITASEVAQRGGTVVTQVVETMEQIDASSKRIAEIIGTIDGIAFQTNILALNAAVEAARAGEQGRGFAVVAGEVRTLAQRSAEAAKEIRGLIGVSVQRVQSGSRLVADAGSTMHEIVASVRRVSDVIGVISAAAGEQNRGLGAVNTAVAQLDELTQRNAALVEQCAATAQSLKDEAGTLAGAVAAFRLQAA